jgi:hypothetical protein
MLSLPLDFQASYPVKNSATILVGYGTNGEQQVQFTSNFDGTVHFTIPAGTNLSTLVVEVPVNGAVGYGATGYVGFISVQ